MQHIHLSMRWICLSCAMYEKSAISHDRNV